MSSTGIPAMSVVRATFARILRTTLMEAHGVIHAMAPLRQLCARKGARARINLQAAEPRPGDPG